MGGTTAPLGFPYPTGTDRVMDGDNAIQALADAVDDYFVGVDNVSGLVWAPVAVGGQSRLYRRGRMGIFVSEGIGPSGGGVGSGVVVVTFPAGYRPPFVVRFTGIYWPSQGTFLMDLNADGTLNTVSGLPAGQSCFGTLAYPIA